MTLTVISFAISKPLSTRSLRNPAHGVKIARVGSPLACACGSANRCKFGHVKPIIYKDGVEGATEATTTGRNHMIWASKIDKSTQNATRIEDGFLRSRGLGADLIPPLSLVCDDLGIYYDPTQPSRLEALISASPSLSVTQRLRAEALMTRLVKTKLSKYNTGALRLPTALPTGRRILVPGQVEDDASIQTGAGDINTNRALLAAARAANPAAVILYKPPPDVEAGLRAGTVEDAESFANAVLTETNPILALLAVDAVWTMTSLLGFEALLHWKGRHLHRHAVLRGLGPHR